MRPPADLTVTPDDDLVERVRAGDDDAYVALYDRHAARAKRVARSTLDDAGETEDVVAEAFASMLSALRRGKGPTEAFAGYLVSAVRHEAFRANRRRTRQRAVAERGTDDITDPYGRRDEAAVLRAAFDSLPAPAREVLWRTEVNGESHAEVAAALGATTQAVATRASRARQALGGAYLAGHLGIVFDEPPSSPVCAESQRLLVDLVRGTLRPRRARKLEAHLATCAACRRGRHQLEQLNERLRTTPPLLPLAGGGMSGIVHVGAGAGSIAARLGATLAPLVATGAVMTVAVVGPIAPSSEAGTTAVRTAPASADLVTLAPSAEEPPRLVISARAARTARTATTPAAVDPGPAPATTPTTDTASPVPEPPTPPPVAEPPPVTGPPVTGPPAVTEPPPVPTPPGPPSTSPPPLITVPPITMPEITVPEITIPPVTLPEITVPPVGIGPVVTPPIVVPPIDTPPIGLPPIGLPPIETPPITVPPILPPIPGP